MPNYRSFYRTANYGRPWWNSRNNKVFFKVYTERTGRHVGTFHVDVGGGKVRFVGK